MESISENSKSRQWMAPFFTIWTGQAFSLLGSQLVQFALIWWLTQKTGSATILATASLVGLLPQVFLGPIAGVLVDRWNRRITMIVADSCIALATFGLAVLFWTGAIQVWHIYLILFVRALGGGFHWTAMQASTSLMVPKEHLSRIQGLNQMLGGAMNIGAAPLGALLLGLMPMYGILFIDIGTAMLAVLPLLFIPIPQPVRSPSPAAPSGQASLVQDLKEGLRYVWAWPGLLLIIIMAMLINLLMTPAGTLQPLLVTRHFGGQAMQLAILESSWGIGVVVGGLTLSVWGGFKRRVITSLAGLVVMGASLSVIGLTPSWGFYIAVAMMFILGFTNPIVNGPLIAAVQGAVAPDIQGRVFTLMTSGAAAMMPVGLIIAGPASDALGIQTWYLVGGITTIIIALAAFLIPAVMNFEEDHRAASQAAVPASSPVSPLPAKSATTVETGD